MSAEVVDKENLNPQDNPKESLHSTDILNEHVAKIQNLEDTITKLNFQINKCKNEQIAKEKCINTALQDISVQKNHIIEYKKLLSQLELNIAHNCKKFSKQKELIAKDFEEKQAKFTAKESEYTKLVKKHELAKTHIAECQSREDELANHLKSSEARLASLCADYASLEKLVNDGNRPCQEAIDTNEQLLKEIATMESVIRRLTIKTTAQQSELDRKKDECNALSALCEDITSPN